MSIDASNEKTGIDGQPVWHRPVLTSVVIGDVTLGKLGSEVDLGFQDNNFSE